MNRAFCVVVYSPVALLWFAAGVAVTWVAVPTLLDLLVGLLRSPTWFIWIIVWGSRIVVWGTRIVAVPVAGLLTMILFYSSALDVRAAIRGDPIVLRGEVVKKDMSNDFKPALPIRRMFGYDLFVDVKAAWRLGGGSPSWDPEFVGSQTRVRTIRRLYRQVAVGQEVSLVCTRIPRAVAHLSDLPDTGAIKDLMAALATGPAPELGSSPDGQRDDTDGLPPRPSAGR